MIVFATILTMMKRPMVTTNAMVEDYDDVNRSDDADGDHNDHYNKHAARA